MFARAKNAHESLEFRRIECAAVATVASWFAILAMESHPRACYCRPARRLQWTIPISSSQTLLISTRRSSRVCTLECVEQSVCSSLERGAMAQLWTLETGELCVCDKMWRVV
jgi:hypothetical protein